MSDDMISQEEIDALLNGGVPNADGGDAPAADAPAADGADAPAAEAAPEAPAEGGTSDDSSQFEDRKSVV